MLLIDPNSKLTQKKFQSLKDLYHQITGPQQAPGLEQLFDSIQSWKRDNQATLNELRVRYFWDSFFTRNSATNMLITEIQEDLQPRSR